MSELTMTTQVLSLRSPGKVFSVPSNPEPHIGQIDKWTVSETIEPFSQDRPDEKMQQYFLKMSREVTKNELCDVLEEAHRIIAQLNVVWCFVCRRPFSADRSDSTDPRSPYGWTSDFARIEAKFNNWDGYFEGCQIVSPGWWPLECMPLKKALSVRESYLNGDPEIRALADLYSATFESEIAELFLLSKGLEIAGAYFGTSRADRNNGLQAEVRRLSIDQFLCHDVEWLFTMANERADTRHAVAGRHPNPVALHQEMTSTEREDFLQDARIILRAFTCDRLKIERIPSIVR